MEAKSAEGRLSATEIRKRIAAIGPICFDEARSVLAHENMLLPPRTDASTYIEFAATYLELRHFTPSFLPHFFPALTDVDAIDALLRNDVDAALLFAATRPTGADAPDDSMDWDLWTNVLPPEEPRSVDDEPVPRSPSSVRYRVLMRKSQRPATIGNLVRTAICHARAACCAPPELVLRTDAALRSDIHRMAARLQTAMELDPTVGRPWEAPLLALLHQTPRGIWTVEARLLYDLQKVCIDHERDVYTVDLVEWALSLGRRPIKRRLPAQRDVLMLKHLRSASRRLSAAHIPEPQRRQLAYLLRDVSHRIEARLREHLRPRIIAALDRVGLLPGNLPERVARKKLVEELLDRIEERGFLAIGNLRDAISRNNLKLPDIVGPLSVAPHEGVVGRVHRAAGWAWRSIVDFLHGDQLLRADRHLSLTLDGVYRRGEIYMRLMQRLSSPSFGTAIGRLFTRFISVPFGGAFALVVFITEIWGMIAGVKTTHAAGAGEAAQHQLILRDVDIAAIILLGLFLLGLVNSVRFRRAAAGVFKGIYSVFHVLIVEPIGWLAKSPFLRYLLGGWVFSLLFRFGIKPAIWTAAVWGLLRAHSFGQADWQTSPITGVSLFLAFNLILNSRPGRNAEEVLADWLAQGWRRFGLRLILGLFWFVVDLFRALVEAVERLIYTVDEWLRFRSGERRAALVLKAVTGAIWFFVAYIVRFAVNVLIEPQINPVKHFPVVTVGHKLLLGAYIPFAHTLERSTGMSAVEAGVVATTIIWSIPGIFGFLVWELKENWRLYAANRRPGLTPVIIGSHGENMGRLLRPGFHSGTLPKRFSKLRTAERRARTDGRWRPVHKHLQALEHVEQAIRRYIERDFVEFFTESQAWPESPPTIEQVCVSTNSVRFTLRCDATADAPPLKIAIDAESGWLLAGLSDSNWAKRLPPEQRRILTTAILGLYKTAGVQLVRQQLEAEFAPPMPQYNITSDGLVLWPDENQDVEVVYDLTEAPWIAAQSVRGLARRRLPTIERTRILFSETTVPWDRWVRAWDCDLTGESPTREPILPTRVLP
ncbi:MAG: hypothetical protein LLG00_17150 [Planctomycetaceae bacterium]|nr:hypothetical protein [Planctomycetaceae bacterium]